MKISCLAFSRRELIIGAESIGFHKEFCVHDIAVFLNDIHIIYLFKDNQHIDGYNAKGLKGHFGKNYF
jgi:hypothetical protein